MSQPGLSLVVITFNEEQNIARCIKSVPFASEVVVIDSGSTDRTVGIAKQLGARVLVESWRGFYKQKIRATAVAMNKWILFLDADEALSPELAEEIQKLISGSDFENKDAYSMPRKAFHMGKWISSNNWYPDRQVKLFNKENSEWVDELPHEIVKAEKVGSLKSDLHHWIYTDVADHVGVINRATNYEALKLLELGKNPGSPSLIGFVKQVLVNYFLRGGATDGLPGLMISITSAYKEFLLKVKYKELKRLSDSK